MSSSISCRSNGFRSTLVFHAGRQESCHNPNAIRHLDADLVLHEIPGNGSQLPGHPQRLGPSLHGVTARRTAPARRLRRTRLRRARLEHPPGPIVWIVGPPARLVAPPSLPLTLGTTARALPLAYPRIRSKPSPTDPARPLLRHAASSPTVTATPTPAPGLLLASTPGSVLASAEVEGGERRVAGLD